MRHQKDYTEIQSCQIFKYYKMISLSKQIHTSTVLERSVVTNKHNSRFVFVFVCLFVFWNDCNSLTNHRGVKLTFFSTSSFLTSSTPPIIRSNPRSRQLSPFSLNLLSSSAFCSSSSFLRCSTVKCLSTLTCKNQVYLLPNGVKLTYDNNFATHVFYASITGINEA